LADAGLAVVAAVALVGGAALVGFDVAIEDDEDTGAAAEGPLPFWQAPRPSERHKAVITGRGVVQRAGMVTPRASLAKCALFGAKSNRRRARP
jgi:hypothetical protein